MCNVITCMMLTMLLSIIFEILLVIVGEVRPVATTPVSQRLPLTTQRSTESNQEVSIDMNLPGSDLNVEQLPSSPGGSSPNGSNNNNNENRKLLIFIC